MDQVNNPKRAMLGFAILSGALPALIVIVVLGRHSSTQHWLYKVAGILVVSMPVGALWGLLVWKVRQALGSRLMTRAAITVQTVLFVSLMLGLSYALWLMSRH
jgi:hypothetical protein